MPYTNLRVFACFLLLGMIGFSGCSNLSVAVSPKVTQADLQKVKKVAINLDGGGSAAMSGPKQL